MQRGQLPESTVPAGYGGAAYWSGVTVSVSCRVVRRAVGAARGSDDYAVKNRLEVPTLRAGQPRAAMLCYSMGASTLGTYSRVLGMRFYAAKSTAIVVLLGGGLGVNSLDDVVAARNQNLGKIGLENPICGRSLYQYSKSLLVMYRGVKVGVKEASFGNKDALRVKDGGLMKVT